jgi:hypothetical protein
MKDLKTLSCFSSKEQHYSQPVSISCGSPFKYLMWELKKLDQYQIFQVTGFNRIFRFIKFPSKVNPNEMGSISLFLSRCSTQVHSVPGWRNKFIYLWQLLTILLHRHKN